MKPMGSEANQLINAGRQAFHPTEADRARVLAALAGTAALSIGAGVAAHAANRSLHGIFSFAPAARLMALALPVAAAGLYGWHMTDQSPAPMQAARSVPAPSAVVAPRVVEPPAPLPDVEAAEVPAEPNAPSAPGRSDAPVGEAPKPGVEIRQEVALLSKAQAALSRGRPQEALVALTEHAQRFPRGVLSEERAATRARTLCALGRRPEAEVELKRIEKLNPGSAYLARARESCGPR